MLFIILVGFEIKFEKKLPMPLLAVAAVVVEPPRVSFDSYI
ncbi:hypothetical protein EBGED10_51100 [Bacillus sp. GeD10]|nr:hypothetical protein EBGED10_51100 [Bacillus sp. GeD10]